jgi:hypothetical protein
VIWLTWRQHRKQALFAVLGLIVVAGLMFPTGLQMHRDFDRDVASCLAAEGRTEFARHDDEAYSACRAAVEQFNGEYFGLIFLAVLFALVPLFVGLFFGAPLVAREVEHGTHRLVWTQGVTRLRWALTKFGLVGTAVLVFAIGYSAMLTWWTEPLSRANGRFPLPLFDLQAAVPVGYTLFALALGIFAGTVWRKVLPAMAVTLVGFLGVRAVVTLYARVRYERAEEYKYLLTSETGRNRLQGDWIYSQSVHRADGQRISANSEVICGVRPEPTASPVPTPTASPEPDSCIEDYGAGAYNLMVYQPSGRFWEFQIIETGMFVALAAVLLALAIHQVRRRIT